MIYYADQSLPRTTHDAKALKACDLLGQMLANHTALGCYS